MKHLLLIGFAFLALNASAQKVDTVKNAIQVTPVQINSLTKDTVYQATWSVFVLEFLQKNAKLLTPPAEPADKPKPTATPKKN